MTPDNETLRKWAEAAGLEIIAHTEDWGVLVFDDNNAPHVLTRKNPALLPLIAEILEARIVESQIAFERGEALEETALAYAYHSAVVKVTGRPSYFAWWPHINATAAQRAAAAYAVLKKTPLTEHAADTD